MNAWWRLWFSAFLRTDSVVAWIKQIIPAEFAFGNNLPTEPIVCDLLESFSRTSFSCPLITARLMTGCTLKFVAAWPHKCFATCLGASVPLGSLGCRSLPVPFEIPSFASTVGFVWLDGCTSIICAHVCPTLTIVPLSPTILLSWLTDCLRAWSQWAQSVGLRENVDKAAAVAKGVRHHEELAHQLPGSVASSACLLGVTVSRSAVRGDSDKEASRIEACLRTVRLIACVGMPCHRFIDAVRMFAISKLSYGWITRLPTWTSCKSIWSAIGRGLVACVLRLPF